MDEDLEKNLVNLELDVKCMQNDMQDLKLSLLNLEKKADLILQRLNSASSQAYTIVFVLVLTYVLLKI